MKPSPRSDRGASMLLLAMSLMMLMGAAAIAVDLAAMRVDRSADQKVTDSAASAGALEVLEGSGQDACETALAYVAINSEEIGSIDSSGCSTSFPGACSAGDSHTVTSGRFTITVTHPVADSDPLMTSGALGAVAQTTVPEDGDPCDRVAVQMSAVHDGLFARLLGFDQGTTTVHSVARAFLPPPDGPPLNLVVLDRFECQGIRVEGNGGVIVNSVIDPATGNEYAGLAAADSDATSGIDCADGGDNAGVLHIKGSGPLLRADGPPGCSYDDPATPAVGEGCGSIQVYEKTAPPGCNFPRCTPGAGGANPPVPPPEVLEERLTRAQIDHTYNCWGDYTWTSSTPGGVSWATNPLNSVNQQAIPGCTAGTSAHIYDLLAAVGPSGAAGHQSWTGPPTRPCNVTASQSFNVVGDTWVDCNDFIVEGNVTISGNVIFQGNVHVKSDGRLEILNSDGWVVFRGNSPTGTGRFKKDGQADLIIEQTAVYLSKTSWVEIAGGDLGVLRWNAPSSNTSDFKDLALWSDSPSTHFWSGQGQLQMSGAFFTPLAKADYAGTSGQNQTEAQWIADKLVARGQGKLVIQPKFSHPFKRDPSAQTVLVR